MSFIITKDSGSSGEIEWLIPNMIVQNRFNMFDGRGSSGKSSVVSKIIGDWHNNRELPNSRRLKKVLWLSEEEELNSEIRPRLMQYGLSHDQVVTIDYASGNVSRPILPDDQERFIGAIKSNNINCIVIDPIHEVKHGDWSMFNPDQMRSFIGCFGRICTITRSTMFGMRHMRKASGTHSADDGLGCAQIRDTARAVLRVDKTEDREPRFFLTAQKINRADPTKPLEFAFGSKINGFSKVEFLGHFDGSIQDVKDLSSSLIEKSKLDEAITLLTESLHDGDKACIPLYEEAKANGIGDRTLDKAKAKLKVTSHRIVPTEGKAYSAWRLPAELRSNKYIFIKGREMPQLTLEDLTPNEKTPFDVPAIIAEQAKTIESFADFIPDNAKQAKKAAKPKAAKPKAAKPKAKNQPSK